MTASSTLTIVRATGLATVQDLGRRGHMHEAVPPGGALVDELLIAANRAVGNPDDAAAIEVLGQLVVRIADETASKPAAEARGVAVDVRRQVASGDSVDVRREVARGHGLTVAIDGTRRELALGEELVVSSGERRCAYLAVRGGIDAPVVLGGRGTLLCAELGRPLRAGDIVRAGSGGIAGTGGVVGAGDVSASDRRGAHTEIAGERPIEIIAGPDLEAFDADAIARLVAAPYRVLPSSDRVGTRLAGVALPRVAGYRERSRPMIIGAIEVPGDGQPIVLGPEHPTTGGYPIIAVIATAELGRFFAIRLGGSVRFVVRA